MRENVPNAGKEERYEIFVLSFRQHDSACFDLGDRYGLLQKVDIFDAFIEGAVDGFKTVYKILPTLIGLMIAIGILRESGTLGYVASVIAPVTERLHFPSELVPLVTVKMFSSSAATSLLLDVYKQFGPDSQPRGAGFGAYELLGDHFLHNECVFYDSKSDKDKIYTCRCFVCDACRNCHVNAAYRVLIFVCC